MTSIQRVEANRINAKKSTGPRTERGKAIVRLNAVRHGINSCLPVLARGESRAKWDKFAAAIVADLRPAGPLEAVWAGRVALLQWRLLRCGDARQTVAGQQWREAAMAAPRSEWWQHRRTIEQLPASLEEQRRCMRDNRRLQNLLSRVAASARPMDGAAQPDQVAPLKQVAHLDDATAAGRRVDGKTAMALVDWIAGYLHVGYLLHDPWRDGRRRYPVIGVVEDDLKDVLHHPWDLELMCGVLTTVGSWAELELDELLVAAGRAMREAFNEMRRVARRAEKEMRQFRLVSTAKPSEDSQKFDRYETDLERRLYLAMSNCVRCRPSAEYLREMKVQVWRKTWRKVARLYRNHRENKGRLGLFRETGRRWPGERTNGE